MTIRRAELSDLAQLSQLFDAYRVFYKKISDLAGASDFLKARMMNQESHIFVAEDSNRLVGFVQLYPLFSSTRMKKLWLLNDLFVDVAHRGRGISILLIDQAKVLAVATASCGLMLETAKANEVGNQLYPRTGFVVDQEHNFYSWNV